MKVDQMMMMMTIMTVMIVGPVTDSRKCYEKNRLLRQQEDGFGSSKDQPKGEREQSVDRSVDRRKFKLFMFLEAPPDPCQDDDDDDDDSKIRNNSFFHTRVSHDGKVDNRDGGGWRG